MFSKYYTSHKFSSVSAELPVALADVRSQLKMDDLRHDDEYLTTLTKGQCAYVEYQYAVALLSKTVVEYHSKFPCKSTEAITLHVVPGVTVTSIQYIDSDGTTQTWASSEYDVTLSGKELIIIPKVDYCYPTDLAVRPDAVIITYTAGFGNGPSSIPAGVRMGILSRIGRAYAQREDAPEYQTSMSDVLLHELKRY